LSSFHWWSATCFRGIIMLTIILVVLVVLALGGGGWGHSRFGAASWSPLGILVLILVVLFFTGNLHA